MQPTGLPGIGGKDTCDWIKASDKLGESNSEKNWGAVELWRDKTRLAVAPTVFYTCTFFAFNTQIDSQYATPKSLRKSAQILLWKSQLR